MAGSWATGVAFRKGYLNGAYSRPVGVVKSFVADAANGSVPEVTVEDVFGLLTGIDVEFGGTAPNALVVTIKSISGITLVTGSSLTASGRISVSPPVDVCGGYKIALSGNSTNSAIGTIVALFR